MSSGPCPWSVTDAAGNKYNLKDAALVYPNGKVLRFPPLRGRRPRGTPSWSRIRRDIRSGTAHMVLDLRCAESTWGVGEGANRGLRDAVVRFSPAAAADLVSEGNRTRKVSEYSWGAPDVMLRSRSGASHGTGAPDRGVLSSGHEWVAPEHDWEREMLADLALLSTLSRVSSSAKENAGHAEAVLDAAVSRMLADSPMFPKVAAKDNPVVRARLKDLLTGKAYPHEFPPGLTGDSSPREVLSNLEMVADGGWPGIPAGLRAGRRVDARRDVAARNTLGRPHYSYSALRALEEHFPEAHEMEKDLLARGIIDTVPDPVVRASADRVEELQRGASAAGVAAYDAFESWHPEDPVVRTYASSVLVRENGEVSASWGSGAVLALGPGDVLLEVPSYGTGSSRRAFLGPETSSETMRRALEATRELQMRLADDLERVREYEPSI